MKNLILFIATGIIVMSLMSYTGTNGVRVDGQGYDGYSLPLKQKNIIVTSSYDHMKTLLGKGYVCEDVDLAFHGYYATHVVSAVEKYYTMVKY